MEKTGIAPGENVLWPGAGFSCDFRPRMGPLRAAGREFPGGSLSE